MNFILIIYFSSNYAVIISGVNLYLSLSSSIFFFNIFENMECTLFIRFVPIQKRRKVLFISLIEILILM